jgi:hypothetical protein
VNPSGPASGPGPVHGEGGVSLLLGHIQQEKCGFLRSVFVIGPRGGAELRQSAVAAGQEDGIGSQASGLGEPRDRNDSHLARETSCGNGSSMLATAIKLIPGLYRAERGELANSLFRDENGGMGARFGHGVPP